jgi:cytochrome c oxidase cbb3-type subunit 3
VMRRSTHYSSAAVVILVCLLTACDPPGKPKLDPGSGEKSEQATASAVIYAANCAGCHGDQGKNGPARILNDSLYLAVAPKEAVRDVIANGRPGTSMPPWAVNQGGPLTDNQIDGLVSGLYASWGKPVTLKAAPPAYSGNNSSGDVAQGKKLFGRDCFMCHGPGAKIGSVTDPNYLALSSDQLLRTSIIVGRPDLGMPDYRFLNLGKPLADQDVTDIVAYLASLRPVAMGQRTADSGTGQPSVTSKGNEGSGNGPGSPRQQKNEGNKGKGSSSQQGVK